MLENESFDDDNSADELTLESGASYCGLPVMLASESETEFIDRVRAFACTKSTRMLKSYLYKAGATKITEDRDDVIEAYVEQ
jgi:hypothetical protein